MKNKIFGLIILFAGVLAFHHLLEMLSYDFSRVLELPDLFFGSVILLIIGAGIGLKVIKINA